MNKHYVYSSSILNFVQNKILEYILEINKFFSTIILLSVGSVPYKRLKIANYIKYYK